MNKKIYKRTNKQNMHLQVQKSAMKEIEKTKFDIDFESSSDFFFIFKSKFVR